MGEIVSSKDLCILIKEVLRLMDKRLIGHGERVGYILSRMLECEGSYEDFELAEFALLGTLHDIGAFKVEKTSEMLKFDLHDYMPHSIYGYLFLKYVSPMDEMARTLMYSHIDYSQLVNVDFEHKNIANYINLAGRYDLYNKSLGTKFEYNKLRVYEGTKYDPKSFELLDMALAKYSLKEKLDSKMYLAELDKIYDDLMFSDEEKEQYIMMLMYVSGFRDEVNVLNTVTSLIVAEEIANIIGGFTEDEHTQLYFGALLHDVGMLTVPLDIINAPRKLSDEEMNTMRNHVLVVETLLKDRVDEGVYNIAVRHHERMDGSGYPNHLTGADMNMLEKILQVADTVTGLTVERMYRKSKPKEAVIAILTDEMNHNKFRQDIVLAFINNYDTIMDKVKERSQSILQMFFKLQKQYEQVSTAMIKK